MSVLLIYQSKYGSTKQYAKWINEEVKGGIIDIKDAANIDYDKYDVIVLGSYCHASRIAARKYIISNWHKLNDRKFILFTVSSTPPEAPGIEEMYKASLPENIREGLIYFPLRGRLSFNKLEFGDKVIMRIGQFIMHIAGKKDIAKGMVKDNDWVKRDSIKPIVDKIKSML